ncbi:DNA mismatch repair protein MutT [Knoellia sinensis KCTC 19936]|uniref:DNA mismatch repair protein MutT n=1 Tax=Knoellia sinensis KCTC 19936 TaxID=1385520 RepID=A0A0A0J5Z1_9MICO|nr:NUDIX domain-containing protein [Knoellia sinensis]KGN32623.1 DNA mismatch repair protein MutT [Knoellia sinensis KCTC 19936]
MSAPNAPFALVPASYVYLRRGDEVLLQCRANTGYMDGHWVAGAAGHVEPGETALEAAIREVEEELGVGVRPQDLTFVTVMQRTNGSDEPIEQRVDWFWTARSWEGEPRIMEPAKCSGLEWFDLGQLPAPIPDYEHRILRGLGSPPLGPVTSHGFGDELG